MLKISKNIKKIALSLLVIGLAIGTQAFRNAEAKLVDTRYLIGYDSGTDTYTFQTADPAVCNQTQTPNPCEITTLPGYPSLGATGTLPGADVRDPAKINQDSWRANY